MWMIKYKNCKELLSDINTASLSQNNMNGKADYIENHSRRNNLIFEGIAESEHEKWANTEEKPHTTSKWRLSVLTALGSHMAREKNQG